MLDHQNFQHYSPPIGRSEPRLSLLPPGAPAQLMAWMTNLLDELERTRRDLTTQEAENRTLHHALTALWSEQAQERQRYQGLLTEALQGTLVTDKAGVIREANHPICTLLGLDELWLLGKPLLTFIRPADHAPFCVQLARLRLGRPFEEIELELRPRRGEPFSVRIQAQATYDGADKLATIRWVVRPVKFGQSPLTALLERYQTLHTLFLSSPLTVIALDTAGRVTMWNRAAERMFGWQADEVMGRPLPIVPPSAQVLFQRQHDSLIAGQPLTGQEGMHIRKDNSEIFVSFSAVPLYDAEQRLIGIMMLMDDITEERRLGQELALAHQHLEQSREAERLHLAHELHDTVVQQLIGLSYQVTDGLRHVVAADEDPQQLITLTDTLTTIQGGLRESLQQLRGVVRTLRPAGLDEFGLFTALRGYLTDLQTSLNGQLPQLTWELVGDDRSLSPLVAICLFRVAQEGITNVLKHADARRICLDLRVMPTKVRLRLRDDGRGFEVPTCLLALAQDDHFGLLGMQERVTCLNGKFTIISHPGVGTCLTVCLPLSKASLGV